jgi:HPt (histidine-containing phosphotransfer) domain-containing protein
VSDPRERETAEAKRKQLIVEFLRNSADDVERMRALATPLRAGEQAAWSELRSLAHNMAAGAATHRLGVLASCARELENLCAEIAPDALPSAFQLHCVSSAIEALALEVEALREGM